MFLWYWSWGREWIWSAAEWIDRPKHFFTSFILFKITITYLYNTKGPIMDAVIRMMTLISFVSLVKLTDITRSLKRTKWALICDLFKSTIIYIHTLILSRIPWKVLSSYSTTCLEKNWIKSSFRASKKLFLKRPE